MTKDEFTKMLEQEPDFKGITENEVDLYYFFYKFGRQSTRW